MSIAHFWIFAGTGLLLNLTPGNDMLYVITRSTGGGVKAGIVSALGIGAGCLVHILAAVAGLSALIARSALAFDIIKYAGACYLVYLGIRSLLHKKRSFTVAGTPEAIPHRKIFWQGVVTNALNPKVALFFLAFLPQFINVQAGNTALQILFLGVWFDATGTLVNIGVALLFGKIGGWLSKSSTFIQWQERITGMILVALGIKVALGSRQ